jgi:hypothetical protein
MSDHRDMYAPADRLAVAVESSLTLLADLPRQLDATLVISDGGVSLYIHGPDTWSQARMVAEGLGFTHYPAGVERRERFGGPINGVPVDIISPTYLATRRSATTP